MAFKVDFSLKRLITLSTCEWFEARKMFSLMCNPVFIFNLKEKEKICEFIMTGVRKMYELQYTYKFELCEKHFEQMVHL